MRLAGRSTGMAIRALKLAAFVARLLPQPVRQSLYRLGPISRWIRAALNQAAPDGSTPLSVAAGPLEGATMVLDLKREKDYWLGSYEPDLLHALAEFAGEGMTVFDVGANIGYITLAIAGLVGEDGLVVAFEALPSNVRRLEEHVRLNGFDQRVSVVHAAVVDRGGPVEFLVHESHGMGKAAGSAGRKADYGQSIEVPGISIDDYVFRQANPAPDVVKMDIEGGEVLALRGMGRVLASSHPVLLLELHGQAAAEAAWESLAKARYTLHSMGRGYPRVDRLESLDWKSYLLALPGDPA